MTDHVDLEVAALHQIAAAMEVLDRRAQGRVADWVYDRYHLRLEEELGEGTS